MTTPERWQLDAGDAATATLTIPADARRERRFEIACAVTVGVPEQATAPWLQVTVQANGAQQWRHRVAAARAGCLLQSRQRRHCLQQQVREVRMAAQLCVQRRSTELH